MPEIFMKFEFNFDKAVGKIRAMHAVCHPPIVGTDVSMFRYLADAAVYIPMLAVADSGYTADVTSLAETEKTYRVRFRVKSEPDDTGTVTESDEYFALVIKREDGTLYIKKLLHGNEVQ